MNKAQPTISGTANENRFAGSGSGFITGSEVPHPDPLIQFTAPEVEQVYSAFLSQFAGQFCSIGTVVPCGFPAIRTDSSIIAGIRPATRALWRRRLWHAA